MKVKELIEYLKAADPEKEVMVYDGEYGELNVLQSVILRADRSMVISQFDRVDWMDCHWEGNPPKEVFH